MYAAIENKIVLMGRFIEMGCSHQLQNKVSIWKCFYEFVHSCAPLKTRKSPWGTPYSCPTNLYGVLLELLRVFIKLLLDESGSRIRTIRIFSFVSILSIGKVYCSSLGLHALQGRYGSILGQSNRIKGHHKSSRRTKEANVSSFGSGTNFWTCILIFLGANWVIYIWLFSANRLPTLCNN
jgi:hypothetical protein